MYLKGSEVSNEPYYFVSRELRTFQRREDRILLRSDTRNRMSFQHLALHTLLRRKFSPLVRKRKRWLSNEGKHNLGLIAFMNILNDPLPMSNLGRRQRMHRVAQVVDRGLAHLVLMSDRRDGELSRLLLNN